MRSTLFRIPYEIGGVPLFGFGILLAVWGIVAAAVLIPQVRRHGWGRETFGYLGSLALVAAFIVLLPRFFSEGMPIRGYGLMVLVGVISGIGISAWRTKQVGLHPDVMVSLCMWMLVMGIVGARLFYVIQYWEQEIRQDSVQATVLEILNFPAGGLVIYGALLAGAAAFFHYNWRHRLPSLAMGDLLAPGVALGIAFGRLGCFLNGCCFGDVCELPLAVTFPRDSTSAGFTPPYAYQMHTGQLYGLRLGGDPDAPPAVQGVRTDSLAGRAGLKRGDLIASVNGKPIETNAQAYRFFQDAIVDGAPLELTSSDGRSFQFAAMDPPLRSLPVHPVQLYSALNAGLLAVVLWLFYPFGRRDGEVGALLMILYSASRFLLEALRSDEHSVFGTGLTISQNVSIVIFLVGMTLMIYLRSHSPQRAFLVWGAKKAPDASCVAS